MPCNPTLHCFTVWLRWNESEWKLPGFSWSQITELCSHHPISLCACGNKSDEFVTIMSRPKLGFLSSSHAHKQEAAFPASWAFILIPGVIGWRNQARPIRLLMGLVSLNHSGGMSGRERRMATKCLMFHYKCQASIIIKPSCAGPGQRWTKISKLKLEKYFIFSTVWPTNFHNIHSIQYTHGIELIFATWNNF